MKWLMELATRVKMLAHRGVFDDNLEEERSRTDEYSACVGDIFSHVGVQAALGRMLSEDDDRTEGEHPVAVVSYAWWTRTLGRDFSALGKRLTIGSSIFTVVGESPDIWIPLSMRPSPVAA